MSKKKEIAVKYDASAEIYDARYANIQAQKYEEILLRVMLNESDAIIDIGCGTGSFLSVLSMILEKKSNQPLVGIDLSFEMIKIAHEKHPEIDFLVADSDHLPFRAASFDRLFSVTHLQNLPLPEISLLEIERIAKSQAQLAISILSKHWTLESLRSTIAKTSFLIQDEWTAQIEDIGMLCSKP